MTNFQVKVETLVDIIARGILDDLNENAEDQTVNQMLRHINISSEIQSYGLTHEATGRIKSRVITRINNINNAC